MEDKALYRSCKNRMLGGVAGGLGEYFGVDPNFIRLFFVLSIIPGGIGLIIYLVAWVIIPNDPECKSEKRPKEEIKESAHEFAKQTKENFREARHGDASAIVGSAVVVIGVLLLIKNITGINIWGNFWPVALVMIGLIILWKGIKREEK